MVNLAKKIIEDHPVGRWTLNFTLIVVLIVFGYWTHYQTNTATRFLCIQRTDLDHRIERQKRKISKAETYLMQHPHGIPGISARLINDGIQDDKKALAQDMQTRHNMDVLNCRGEK